MLDRTGAEVVKALRAAVEYAYRDRRTAGAIRNQQQWDKYEQDRLREIIMPVVERAEAGAIELKGLPSPSWERMFYSTAFNSDEGLLSTWSNILAGEMESPGSVPRRLMRMLEVVTKQEADVFVSLCRFVVTLAETPRLLVFGDSEYKDVFTPPTYLERAMLAAAGLLRSSHEHIEVGQKLLRAQYYGSEAERLSYAEMGDWHFTIEGVALYKASRHLVSPDERFRSWLLDEWPRFGPGRVKEPSPGA